MHAGQSLVCTEPHARSEDMTTHANVPGDMLALAVNVSQLTFFYWQSVNANYGTMF